MSHGADSNVALSLQPLVNFSRVEAMKPRSKDESADHYIARLEASNAEQQKKGKWAERVGRAVTWLACDASLAFQAMAEKARVRAHPSVTATVQLFDLIAHPQWIADDAKLPDLNFPTDWDLDPPEAWSGDADMELNSGIAAALEYLESRRFGKCGAAEREQIEGIMAMLERPLQGVVSTALGRAERTPIDIPADADRDALASAINDLSWRALDLAQDLSSTNTMLRRDLRAAAYRRVCHDLYEMADLHVPERNPNFDLKVIGGAKPF